MKRLLTNGKFFSMRTEGESFAAVLLDGEKIETVFTRASGVPASLPSSGIPCTDLGGRTVLPGFIDTHTHAFEGGLYTLGADLSGCRSTGEALALIRDVSPVQGKIFAWRFDENSVAERRFPSLEELDRVHPDLPVFLRRVDGHSCMINSRAFQCIFGGLPAGGSIDPHAVHELLAAGGPLPGLFNSEAARWFHQDLGEEGIFRAYEATSLLASGYGVTTVHAMVDDGKAKSDHYELVRDSIRTPGTEFIPYPQTFNIRRALELGSPRIGGCLLVDGSFGSGTAALCAPYRSRPDSFGTLYRTDEFWTSFVSEAVAHGLSVAVHAIGDAAIAQILRAYRKAGVAPGSLPHQIIHNELATDGMISDMRSLGVSAVMQPVFDARWGGREGMYAQLLGEERALRTNRLGTLVAEGIHVTGGSDWYITPPDALAGMHAAVHLHNASERLTPFQAAELYTSSAARLSGDGHRLGAIAPGYQADLVVLDTDPFPTGDFRGASVQAVMKRGSFLPGHGEFPQVC